MWKAADRNVLATFRQTTRKTANNGHKAAFIPNSHNVRPNPARLGPAKRPGLLGGLSRGPRALKLLATGQDSPTSPKVYTERANRARLKNLGHQGALSFPAQSDSTPDLTDEAPAFSLPTSIASPADCTPPLNSLETAPREPVNFNLVLKRVERIVLENLNDKDVKNQLRALNSLNRFARSACFVDRLLKSNLLSTLLSVLEKPYQKSIWKLVNSYIWHKHTHTPESLAIEEAVLSILISLSRISTRLRAEMGANERLKEALLKIYCVHGQTETQGTRKEPESSPEKARMKGLIEELFSSIGYRVDEKITLVSRKVKESEAKDESWTWDKFLPFTSNGENGNAVSIKDYLIPLEQEGPEPLCPDGARLVWIPYYTSLDPREAVLRNLRVNLGHAGELEGLEELEKVTLSSLKSAKSPHQLGILAVNVLPAPEGSDQAEGAGGPVLELMCNVKLEPSQDLNLGLITRRLVRSLSSTSRFGVLNDIFSELWALLGVRSQEVLDALHTELDYDLIADIVKYSTGNIDPESRKRDGGSGDFASLSADELVPNIFDRFTRLREMVRDRLQNSPKGSLTNLLYNFVSSISGESARLSVDLDEISSRMELSKIGAPPLDWEARRRENTAHEAKLLQMTLFGFLVELIYVDGNRTFARIRDHERLIEAVRQAQSTLQQPVDIESVPDQERSRYRPVIDKRLELKTVATNVVNQENLSADCTPFNSYKGLVLNGIDFLDIRMNSWRKQKQCLKEDLGPVYNSNKLMNILGYHRPRARGGGVRILALDGGGSKGVVALEILDELHRHLGRPLHECFDIICGTSTGGLVASLLALEKMEVAEIKRLYDTMIKSVFVRDSYHVTGTRLLMKQAIYDDDIFKDILKTSLEEIELIDYSVDPSCPKFFCVSTQMDVTPLRPIIWRNYNYHKKAYALGPGDQSSPEAAKRLAQLNGGSCTIRLRDAIKATTAAPGYFPLFERNGHLYGDGALYCNNPSVVSLIESKLLFPDSEVELLLSVGNGVSRMTPGTPREPGGAQGEVPATAREGEPQSSPPAKAELQDDANAQDEAYMNNLINVYENCMDHGAQRPGPGAKRENKILSLDQLITHITFAVTTSEMTHYALDFAMPKEVYYRFSPVISNVKIDETNPEVLNTIKSQTRAYLRQGHIQDRFRSIRELIGH